MRLELSTQVQYVKGVGPSRAKALEGIGIETVEDLLHHYPRRHEDRSRLQPIGGIEEGQTVTIRGVVRAIDYRRMRGRLSLVTVVLADDTGSVEMLFWNQPFRRRQFQEDLEVILTGKVGSRRGLQITNPEFEILGTEGDDPTIHTGRITPVYPLTRGITAGAMRRMIWEASTGVEQLVEDYLPGEWVEERSMLPRGEAVRSIHFPDSRSDLHAARHRLKYDELLIFQCALALRRAKAKKGEKGRALEVTDRVRRRILNRIPFELTSAQERAVEEILADMASDSPMTRLLQGDVGSGKTAVAVYAMLVAVANGKQAAVMAPTEILAEQHLRTLSEYLKGSRVRIEILLGRIPVARRRELLASLGSGEIDVVVGTHALIQEDVEFSDLGLVVVDEQHRFGVLQRASLRWKGERPDALFMTATPIPRTLTMTVFGDLDVSVIDEMPPGRKPARTVCFSKKRIEEAYAFVRREVGKGRQAFFVYPLVEESEEMPLTAVTEEVERLRASVFPDIPVGLIHGRMKREEKEEAMRRFRERRDMILAATTVVEVGIDVPNATVMVVEHAERYGLSQLHQLRGRIGRGGTDSTMLLLGDPTTDEGRERLKVMTETTDGFRIAEEDLRLRGPGEVLGTRQHGLPELKIANLVTDWELLTEARRDAFGLVESDPRLETVAGMAVFAEVQRRLGEKMDLGSV